MNYFLSKSYPSSSYPESLKRIHALRKLDGDDVSPDGRSIFLARGARTSKTIIFFHGNTNSPRQFESLGRIFYQKGYNVLIPRVPHHGLKDRMTRDLANLKTRELTSLCDACVDIARGLGDHISVVGFSMGANMSGWVAQNRSDVDKAVIIAPFWGWKKLPTFLFFPAIILLRIFPSMFIWWDRKKKMALTGPTSSYFKFSTRAVAQIMNLGRSVMKSACHFAPKVRSIVVVTSALDDSVNEINLDKIIAAWKRHCGINVTRFQFNKESGVLHDMIDPQQPYQKTSVVYPKLIALIESP